MLAQAVKLKVRQDVRKTSIEDTCGQTSLAVLRSPLCHRAPEESSSSRGFAQMNIVSDGGKRALTCSEQRALKT